MTIVEKLKRTRLQVRRASAVTILVNPDGPEAADEIERLRSERQSLSDRIDVLAKLAGDVRWKELADGSPFTVIDRMMLRDLHETVTASLTQGGNTNG